MLLVQNQNNNPAFNLAAEEYLLTQKTEDIVSLWRNARAVIIGRNQNALEEIDLDFVKQNNITVVRRITGGGAVFHDLGNLNFTFIEPNQQGHFNNYARFTAPIRDYLRTLGVDAQLSGRNDLTVGASKISGNAQTVKSGRIMHHGTLLFSLNMQSLVGALRPKELKIAGKGIKSVRSRVTNIASHLQTPMDVDAFMQGLESYLLQSVPDITLYNYTPQDLQAIEALAAQKYSQWDWNFGSAPQFTLQHSQKFAFGLVEVHLTVTDGAIEDIAIYGDFFGLKDKSQLESALRGARYSQDALLTALTSLGVDGYISGMTPAELAALITAQ